MLLLMFALMAGLISVFYNFNTSAQQQQKNEGDRSREQIVLTNQINTNPVQVTIANTGTIDVTIRALYKESNGQVTYYCDPSTYTSTNIPIGKSLTISFPSGVMLSPQEKVVAATQRGIKTSDLYQAPVTPRPSTTPNTHTYVYGDIELWWENFQYKTWTGNGNFNPNNGWLPGWTITNPESNIAWKVTVRNIGTRGIMVDGNSTFTLEPTATDSGSNPSRRSWYLYSQPTSQPQKTYLPPISEDQTVEIYYVWSSKAADHYLGIYSQSCVCMAFLTFFGNFTDGAHEAYAQTIPFEAAITVNP